MVQEQLKRGIGGPGFYNQVVFFILYLQMKLKEILCFQSHHNKLPNKFLSKTQLLSKILILLELGLEKKRGEEK